MLQNIKAVLFDLDGTLVDSMWMWTDIDIAFLEERGFSLPADLQREIEGMSFTETALYFKGRFSLSEDIETIKEIWNSMAKETYATRVPFKPGVEEFLQYCRSHNIATAIATSNSRELVDAVASSLHFERYIDEIVTSCEVNRGKPAPDVYLEAAKRLKVLPSQCLVFEDIPAGMLAGAAAGMTVIGVEDDFS